ncbi:MAG: aldo/keto reductase [Burkholderiales bacterium]|nr:aldo/keto reductase [Burkholderiales bacterium]
MIPGSATRAGTEALVHNAPCAPGHYSDFLNQHLKLSSLGVGTFPGAATDAVDAAYADIVARALVSGINVIDTAAHYRYGRSMRAVGEGLRRAFAGGVSREQVYVVAKGGFLRFDNGPPDDLDAWFETRIACKGLAKREDLSGAHCLAPGYIAAQIDELREATGLETLDAFLIDQPEVHIPRLGKEELNRRLQTVFAVCEQAVRQDKIRSYGIATFDALRVETDHALFQSLPGLLGLAEHAAALVQRGGQARHHFRVIQLPFNQAMNEGFTRFSQATGHGNVASTLQAAYQLKLFVIGSHGLAKGALATQCADAVRGAMPDLANDAQRALQFNRSTPGLGVSLAGMITPAHLDDLLAVAARPPLAREAYLGLYRRAGTAE